MEVEKMNRQEIIEYGKENGFDQAYNILLLGGYDFFDGDCEEYDDLLQVLKSLEDIDGAKNWSNEERQKFVEWAHSAIGWFSAQPNKESRKLLEDVELQYKHYLEVINA